MEFFRVQRGQFLIYETPVSTVKNPPQTAARIPFPQQDQARQGHHRPPPSCGTQTPHARLIVAMPAGTPQRLRLGRSTRLQQSRDFARIRQQGQRLALGCLVANWNALPEGAASRLGIVTSRKVGGAVQRSRARRLLRESFRQHQHEFVKPVELVLVARPSIAGRDFAEVEKDFLGTLRRAGLLNH